MHSAAEQASEDPSPHPHQSTSTTLPTPSTGHQRSESDVYERLRTYPFVTDREFATGLAIILGHPETPASEEEISQDDDLVLQAKCYYFSRKANLESPLNVADYKLWLGARVGSGTSGNQASNLATTGNISPVTAAPSPPPKSDQQPAQSSPQEPTYPTSFSHIVELITTGQPIPGIQQIRDTLLTGQGAASEKPKRRKPWEKEEFAEVS
ncbi:hypothetical protein BJX68DRAFT_241671 [Aspergillus pseudodeflectus]|uniref:Uncharacterized protein n=1 Tax=Aspergillus pseudodeflectus TaxID=176178 RepID=A0ABR4K3I5_9EURO